MWNGHWNYTHTNILFRCLSPLCAWTLIAFHNVYVNLKSSHEAQNLALRISFLCLLFYSIIVCRKYILSTTFFGQVYICFAVFGFLFIFFLHSPLFAFASLSSQWCSSFHLVFMSFKRRTSSFVFTIFQRPRYTIHVVRFDLQKKSVSAVV